MSITIPDIGSRPQSWFNAQDLVQETTLLRIIQPRPVGGLEYED